MDTTEAIKHRKSVRQFSDEEILEKDFKEIIELATKAPSAYNGQQTSIIYTRDKEKIKEIASLCGGQAQIFDAKAFFLIITDLYRNTIALENKGIEVEIKDSIWHMATVDAGIMAYMLNIAAVSKGYGSTIIGGVNANPDKLAKLFDLPRNTRIVVGLTLGVPKDNKPNEKPKFDTNVVVMEDKYNKKAQENIMEKYEKDLSDWFESIGVNQPKYTAVLERIYSKK